MSPTRSPSSRRPACLAAVLLSLAACRGDDSLTLTASPARFAADGVTVVELEATVLFRGDAVPDGKRVSFSADEALLFDDRDEVAPLEGRSSVQVSTRGGSAKAYLLSPLEATSLRVEASFTTVNQDVLEDAVTVRAVQSPLISSGGYSPTPGAGAVHFSVRCTSRAAEGIENIGALVSDRPEIRFPCSLVLKDHAGEDLPNTPVRFFTEAGSVEDVPATEDDPRSVTYVVPPSPAALPRDVDAFPVEQLAGLVDIGPQGEVNPRDGLVSILAVVKGHEAFDDLNDSGTWELGEPFIDEGEPFLDVDDDGEFVRDIDGPPCCDNDGDGDVDGPNGTWDEDVWIGRLTHVLWTGPVDQERSYVAPAGLQVAGGGSGLLAVRIVDARNNPVAAGDDDDQVQLSITPSSKAGLSTPPGMPEGTLPLIDHAGMATQVPFIFGQHASPFLDVLLDDYQVIFRDFPLTVDDLRASGSRCNTVAWTVEVEIEATAGPGSGFSSVPSTLTATGTLEPECP